MPRGGYIIKNNLDSSDSEFTYYTELIDKVTEDIITDDTEPDNKSAVYIIIRGWVFTKNGDKVRVELLDSDKCVIEDAKIYRKTRKDVKSKFGLADDNKAEYTIKVALEDIHFDTIYIRFSSADEDKLLVAIDTLGLEHSFTISGRILEFLRDKPIRRTIGFIRHHNPAYIYRYIKGRFFDSKDPYIVWRKFNAYTKEDYNKQRQEKFDYNPLISISIPLYNTPLEFLRALLNTVMGQTYTNFELCLADGSKDDRLGEYIKSRYGTDKRIRYVHLDENLGIAGNTNEALKMATGEYVMLTDHDDLLDLAALYEIVKSINDARKSGDDIDIIYTDEDLVDASGSIYSNYRFKSDFNLEMMRHINYICHIFCVKKSILDEVGGFKEEYDGAQDFDLILRCCEKSDKIHHIPKVLYHWRAHEDSTAGNIDSKKYAIDASVNALKAHYERVGIDALVEPTDIFIMLKSTRRLHSTPLVSIIIPSKDHTDDLDKCIKSIIDKSTYTNYEIIVVENNSEDDNTFAYYDKIIKEYDNITVVTYKPAEGEGFNYSKINNFGAGYAKGDYYILLNNDIEVITPDWIERFLGYCMDDKVGAVGAKLYYPDDTVQHCGVVIGVGGFAGHILTEEPRDAAGYFGRLRVQQEISAVTAACMMVDASAFRQIGGFDEEFAVALNDVDLCLKIRDTGLKIILDPNVEMYHYESKSRGYEESKEQHERFKREIKRFRTKWADILSTGDPYYSPNLTHMYSGCSPRGYIENFDIIREIDNDM